VSYYALHFHLLCPVYQGETDDHQRSVEMAMGYQCEMSGAKAALSFSTIATQQPDDSGERWSGQPPSFPLTISKSATR
jgi:hypothetical protein